MNRVELLPCSPSPVEHLWTYHRVTIALDSWPYAGTTTTCEALCMGVPVVARRTPACHASNAPATLLHAVGLGELLTDSDEAYVQAAVALATDPARLQRISDRLCAEDRFRSWGKLIDKEQHVEAVDKLLREVAEEYDQRSWMRTAFWFCPFSLALLVCLI